MKTRKYMNSYRWPVYITGFSKEKAEKVKQLAKEKRMSAGAFIGNLLDEQIQEHEEGRYGNDAT